MPRYNPAVIEPKWQNYWQTQGTFRTPRLPTGEKLYVLDMFPYPSGDGLHVGHPEGQTATDIVCRYQRMKGKCVMHPMGWDAFGLPAEQHAKKTGTHPRITTEKNIGTFRRQEKMLGFSYDWDRELATTDVAYFRWTQWIFLQIFDTWYDTSAGTGRPISQLPIPTDVASQGGDAIRRYQDSRRLAYQLEAPVNWCPALGTVLANEEVQGGVSERGGHPVVRIMLRQWMLRITAYADRLLSDLEGLDWSESIKSMQREWIGRSTGALVDFFVSPETDPQKRQAEFTLWQTRRGTREFPAQADDNSLRIYTTRPDTLFGATYMVLAPEHPLVAQLTTEAQQKPVTAYCQAAARKSDLDRTDLAKEKSGIFTGAFAINPVNGAEVPIWVADYVLFGYGTGAIMAVPAHDTRDFEFANRFGIPIRAVVDPGSAVASHDRIEVLGGRQVFTEGGAAVNSGPYNGIHTHEFKERITRDLGARGLGKEAVNYKLRDWLFSRQHFWGEPFPILHELDGSGNPTGKIVAIPESELPVNLPDAMEFKPHNRPEPPLEMAPDDWLYVTRNGTRYKRETNTMPQWAGSCWYYLRFLDPRNDSRLIDPEVEKAWMPVDLYIGGAEHAVLHLLYARFWHKVLFDRGAVTTVEPFQRLVNQGMILGEIEFTGYRAEKGDWVSCQNIEKQSPERLICSLTRQSAQAVKLESSRVKKQGEHFVLADREDVRVESRAHKMSKSRGNVINPDQVVSEYGADSLRLFEMFMGPLEAVKPWSMEGVNGVRGFLDRAWRMIVDEKSDSSRLNPAVDQGQPDEEYGRVLHKTIQGVTQDLDRLAFNTAISKLMEFVNHSLKSPRRDRDSMRTFVLLLSPFAPHLAEELWEILGGKKSLAYEPWPVADAEKVKDKSIEVPVQILGKLRSRIVVSPEASEAELEQAARSDPRIIELLQGKTVIKVVVVPGRMVNFVVR